MTVSIKQQIKDLCDTDSEEFTFSDWEVEFIDSVSKKNIDGLSEKQKSIISRIWDDAFIHGKKSR